MKELQELPIFPDMEEFDDIITGEGIRRIKGYKCDLPYDKLNALRQDFWQSLKIIPNNIYKAIRYACDVEASILLIKL